MFDRIVHSFLLFYCFSHLLLIQSFRFSHSFHHFENTLLFIQPHFIVFEHSINWQFRFFVEHQEERRFFRKFISARSICEQRIREKFIPVFVILTHISTDSMNQSSIEFFHLSICLRTITTRIQFLHVQKNTELFNNFIQKFFSSIREKSSRSSKSTNDFLHQQSCNC